MFNNNFVRIYYDAEFTGLHRNSSLLSIGMVSESGSHFYAEFTDYDKDQVDDWLQKHVIENLMFNNKSYYISAINKYVSSIDNGIHYDVDIKSDSNDIKSYLLNWLKNEAAVKGDEGKVQFYTDCYAYDWVLLNDLICDNGKALNLPDYLYYIPVDLSTALQIHGEDPDITRETFLGDKIVNLLKSIFPIKNNSENDIKHNSLWDAYVCWECFNILNKEYGNGR